MKIKKNGLYTLLIFIVGACLGALVFMGIFGRAILMPSNTSWIFAHPDDSTQHYLGWVFYRNTPWTFPICMTDGLSSDGMVSCMYTDSIPLFAIFFKILSPLLPETFQYYGIWGVFCFALNGGFGALLLSRIKNNIIFTSLGSFFYTIFFPSITRITHHNSLGAIWLIMIAIILTLDHNRKYKHGFTPVVLWTLACVSATLIHIYFIPMIYFAMTGYLILVVFKDKKYIRAAAVAISSTVFSVLSLYVIGAFEGKSSYADGGYGFYSANINTFFNSMGHSKYIRMLNTTPGQYEGYGYLGFGMLVCCFLGIIIIFTRLEKKNGSVIKNAFAYIKKYRIEFIAFGAVFIVSFLWALSTTVAYNQNVVFSITLPDFIIRKLSIFRATGRFVWLPCLIIMTTAMWLVTKLRKKSAAAALTICVWLQGMDVRNFRTELHDEYAYIHIVPENITTEEWEELSEGVKEVAFVPLDPDFRAYKQLYFEVANLASKKGIKLSSFYLARSDNDSIARYADEQYKLLTSGNGRKDVLYSFFKEEDIPKGLKNFKIYRTGEFIFGKVK
ncbi:MAG: DUF6311 domain-containing protein [Ruminococcus sp.]|uniref:DUF6311 domain-containing protein n=1 Tax=Ruminococcus sp. TaxID=41978 RepID=UPI0025FBB34D|nr:DUF6311 domain-containing protein [Ruminococcus sp.]MCR5599420.1 DUF6311 domain-containing protein [Ruminococcus sp.]